MPKTEAEPAVGRIVRAAGGVVTRPGRDGRREILLVHRPRYDDWSLPKGKAGRHESYRACAVREVAEETGLVCEAGKEVAVTEYEDSAGRAKRVRYFAMRPADGDEPAPHNEVDALRWVTPEDAIELLSYQRDADLVARVLG
jgi:8-oxo-dGTP pyrophosphatase MutT (NUDIX family)